MTRVKRRNDPCLEIVAQNACSADTVPSPRSESLSGTCPSLAFTANSASVHHDELDHRWRCLSPTFATACPRVFGRKAKRWKRLANYVSVSVPPPTAPTRRRPLFNRHVCDLSGTCSVESCIHLPAAERPCARTAHRSSTAKVATESRTATQSEWPVSSRPTEASWQRRLKRRLLRRLSWPSASAALSRASAGPARRWCSPRADGGQHERFHHFRAENLARPSRDGGHRRRLGDQAD